MVPEVERYHPNGGFIRKPIRSYRCGLWIFWKSQPQNRIIRFRKPSILGTYSKFLVKICVVWVAGCFSRWWKLGKGQIGNDLILIWPRWFICQLFSIKNFKINDLYVGKKQNMATRQNTLDTMTSSTWFFCFKPLEALVEWMQRSAPKPQGFAADGKGLRLSPDLGIIKS